MQSEYEVKENDTENPVIENLEPEVLGYQDRLSADFPDLDIQTVSIIGKGWHHAAIEVNHDLVFRIPLGIHTQSEDSVARETTILRHLQGQLPVEIPTPKYIAPENAYFGYKKLPGKILQKALPHLTDLEKAQIVKDWVTIAVAIHQGISLATAAELNLPKFIISTDEAKRIFDLPAMPPEVLNFAHDTIEAALAIDSSSQYMVVLHNDLQYQNMLIDPDSKRVTGLIDWTDVEVGPLPREFAIGDWDQDHGMLEMAAALYEKKTGIRVDQRLATLLKSLEKISDLAIETENEEVEEAKGTLAAIRNIMARAS